MTYEQFQASVETVIANLDALALLPAAAYPFAFSHDYPLEVCECASEISGHDLTFAKMMNREFRETACRMMFEQACCKAGRHGMKFSY